MSRRFQRPTETQVTATAPSPLPTDKPIAVYYRQSTSAQVGNISTAIQTIDMVDHVKKLGWDDEAIWLIDTDAGVSGQRGIDEREGMKTLYEYIIDGAIGAVACQDEDRLFRDVTQIHVNVFIAACRKTGVQVLTPFFTYDFSHPLYGEYHARQFRFKCEMAAEYIKSYIMGRLVPAKSRIAHEGKWFGQGIPVGYMVDMRKQLPNGQDNPTHRKFVVFEPYANVVRAYYHTVVETGGSLRTAMRRILDQNLSFPDCPPPIGFKVNYKIKQRDIGVFPNRASIVKMLTNPMYIGHWMYKNTLLLWNNHEPLIDEETFNHVFNYLSRYTVTGEENPHYNPAFKYVRAMPLEERKTVEAPLCIGLLGSYYNDTWIRAGFQFEKHSQTYLYNLSAHDHLGSMTLWARRVSWIDQAIVYRFRKMIADTYKSQVWAELLEDDDSQYERDRKIKLSLINSVEQSQKNTVDAVSNAKSPEFIRDLEIKYEQLGQEKARLQKELDQIEQHRHKRLSVSQAKEIFRRANEDWTTLNLADQKALMAAFIERIEARGYTRAGAMELVITWRDGTVEAFELGRKPHEHYGATFSNKQRATLLKLFDSGATQLEIAKAFPTHQWWQIRHRLVRDRKTVRLSPTYLSKNETYEEYIAKGGRKGMSTPTKWTREEEQLLRDLVEAQASQLEIMKAIPYRRWILIQNRIAQLMGKGTRVPHSGIHGKLCYNELTDVEEEEVDGTFNPSSETVTRNSSPRL
jgi:hypothetical protein